MANDPGRFRHIKVCWFSLAYIFPVSIAVIILLAPSDLSWLAVANYDASPLVAEICWFYLRFITSSCFNLDLDLACGGAWSQRLDDTSGVISIFISSAAASAVVAQLFLEQLQWV